MKKKELVSEKYLQVIRLNKTLRTKIYGTTKDESKVNYMKDKLILY